MFACGQYNRTADPSDQQSTTALAPQKLNEPIVPSQIQTVSTTFADTGETTISQAIPSVTVDVNPLPDQTPDKMFSRVMYVGTFNWTTALPYTTAASPYSILPFSNLLSLQPLKQIAEGFAYMKADLEISFRLNTSSLYAGLLGIGAFPGVLLGGGNSPSTLPVQARSWLSRNGCYTTISANSQNTATINLPWVLPQDFREVNLLAAGTSVIPWYVFIDILSPLYSPDPTVNAAVELDVFARFMNTKLIFPFEENTLSTLNRGRIVRQSQVLQNVIGSKRPSRSVVRVSKSSPTDPGSSASGTPTVPISVPGIVQSLISDAPSFITDAISTVQPLLDGILSFGGLLDKPEQEVPITRVVTYDSANMCNADVPDQALPLTLYRGSYLNVDHSAVPGGSDPTMLEIAMTPCLHSRFTFVDPPGGGAGSALSTVLPYMASGTPLSFIAGMHQFWRSSMKMRFHFVTPMFNSARFGIMISPNGITPTQQVSNNLTYIVDVRGETVVDITLPYVYPTRFIETLDQPLDQTGAFNQPYQITVYVETSIVSTNAGTTNPRIDMIVWASAAEDAQFTGLQPFFVPAVYSYPNTPAAIELAAHRAGRAHPPRVSAAQKLDRFHIVQQAGDQTTGTIMDAFSRTFPPFLKDSKFATDSHHVTSEISSRVVDVMKRYQTIADLPIYNPSGTSFFPGVYWPEASTLGAALNSLYAFRRGGVKYKLVTNQTADPPPYFAWGIAENSVVAGNASLCTGYDGELSFAVPWIHNVPFTHIGSQPAVDVTGISPAGVTTNNDLQFYSLFTSVRDDYSLGFFIPTSSQA